MSRQTANVTTVVDAVDELGQEPGLSLQALRDSFDVGDEVHVRVRGYRGAEGGLRLGTIMSKESSFALVRFDKGPQKIPYKRLMRVRTAKPVVLEAPNDSRPSHTALRAVPSAFENVRLLDGRSKQQRSERYRAQQAMFTPATEPDEQEPPPPPPPEPVVPPPPPAPPVPTAPEAHAAASTPADVAAWMDMGQSLLPSLKLTAERLRSEAQILADQAQELMDQSDTRLKEADEVGKHIAILERLHTS